VIGAPSDADPDDARRSSTRKTSASSQDHLERADGERRLERGDERRHLSITDFPEEAQRDVQVLAWHPFDRAACSDPGESPRDLIRPVGNRGARGLVDVESEEKTHRRN
jgi:hypothetical protein